MYHVYIIQSERCNDQIYVGYTTNIEKRLSDHNSGTTAHTDKYKPWKLAVLISFENENKAREFETYLKSGSGRAFREKRFLSLSKNTDK